MSKKLLYILIFLSFLTTTYAQENELYEALDSFLKAPSPDNLSSLIQVTDSLQTPNKESQLAKVIVDCNIGFYQERYGYLSSAISSYENASQRFTNHQLSNYDIVTSALIPLGNLYTKTNAYTEAEHTIRGYIALLSADQAGLRKQNNTQNLLAGLVNLSVPLQNQGKYAQAIAILEEARTIDQENLDIQMNLATNYYSIGTLEKAKNIAQSIIKRDPKQTNAYKLLAQIALQEAMPEKAEQLLLKSLSHQQGATNPAPRNLAKTRLALAQTYITNNKLKAAQKELNNIFTIWLPDYNPQQLPEPISLFPENTLLDALDTQAVIFKEKKEPKKSLHVLSLAAHVSDLLNTPQLLQNSKLVLERTDKSRSEQRLDLLYELYNEDKNNLWFEQALQISDRSKSSIVSEAARDKELLAQYASDSLVVKQQNNARALLDIETKLLQIQQSPTASLETIEEIQFMYAQGLIAQRKFREAIEDKYPLFAQNKKGLSYEDLQYKILVNNETVVSYFFGSNSIYQFRISPTGHTFTKIAGTQPDRDKLFNKCVNYNRYFYNASTILNSPDDFLKDAFALYQDLQLPDTKNLIIIPDGMLAFVPFSTLITSEVSGYQFSEMPFLMQSTNISHQVSVHTYQTASSKVSENASVLGVFPIFEGTDLALEHSRAEATAISSTFETSLLMEKDAQRDTAFAKAKKHSILHFSTHASGGSFTSPARLEFIDEPLYVTSLYGQHLQPDLVVLSACETGVGRIATGEGPLSLARGFQYAGAKSLLFSLWKVNDKSTAQLMREFYTSLEKTLSRNISLQTAQKDYITNPDIPNAKKSPYYWGAFIYYGPTEIAQEKTSSYWMWGLSIFGVFLGFLAFKKYGITS